MYTIMPPSPRVRPNPGNETYTSGAWAKPRNVLKADSETPDVENVGLTLRYAWMMQTPGLPQAESRDPGLIFRHWGQAEEYASGTRGEA